MMNIEVTHASGSGTIGLQVTGSSIIINCRSINHGIGVRPTGNENVFVGCTFTGCTDTNGVQGGNNTYHYCVSDNCGEGFTGVTSYYFNCIAIDSAGGGFLEVNQCMNCIAYSCVGDGFQEINVTTDQALFVNCIAVDNGGWGWDIDKLLASNNAKGMLINCAGFNNTLGNVDGEYLSIGFITLTETPFTDAPNDDFSIATAELDA
ncbi:MAG: hypothetical protein ACXABY_37695, partial [Candidatus Thorarchaeota archaeon]